MMILCVIAFRGSVVFRTGERVVVVHCRHIASVNAMFDSVHVDHADDSETEVDAVHAQQDVSCPDEARHPPARRAHERAGF